MGLANRSDRMRVLTVTNMYPTDAYPQFGIFVHEQVESIRALGHDVDVLFTNPRKGATRYQAYALGLPRLWDALRRRRYDLIHAHYVFSGVIARAQWTLPVVVTHHGIELLHRWQGPLCRWTGGWPDENIVVADWMVDVLGAVSVHMIPCGIDLELFRPMDRSQARRELGLDQARRYVLFAGEHWRPEKRFHLAEQAVLRVQQRHPDVELLAVHGQDHSRIPLFMNAADVLVLVSTFEGSPQVIKESLACGLPVVATDAGDSWEVIAGLPDCQAVAPDPAGIAAAIERVITPPRRFDARARLQRFGMQSVARQVVSVYQQALTGRARSSVG